LNAPCLRHGYGAAGRGTKAPPTLGKTSGEKPRQREGAIDRLALTTVIRLCPRLQRDR